MHEDLRRAVTPAEVSQVVNFLDKIDQGDKAYIVQRLAIQRTPGVVVPPEGVGVEREFKRRTLILIQALTDIVKEETLDVYLRSELVNVRAVLTAEVEANAPSNLCPTCGGSKRISQWMGDVDNTFEDGPCPDCQPKECHTCGGPTHRGLCIKLDCPAVPKESE